VSIEDRLVVGLRAYASVRLLTQVISWLGTVYVLRTLDSHALGQYGVALALLNYLAMVFDGTLLEALVQRPPQLREQRAVFTLLTGCGVLLALAMLAASPLMASLVGDTAVGPLVAAMAAVLLLTGACILPHSELARAMAFRRLASIAALQGLTVTVTTVVLAHRGAGAWALVTGLLAGTAVRALLLNLSVPRLLWPTLQIGPAIQYLRFGGLLFLDNLLWRWYTSLDTFLLGRWTGTTSLGFYSLAQQVAELPLEKISTVVNEVSLPAYAELASDRPAAARLLLETVRMHGIIGFPIFWGVAVTAPYFVPVLFGARWALAVMPLMALAAVAPLRLIGSVETPAMTGLGRPDVLIKTKLIVAPVMTVAFVVGCRTGGIRGAALAWLCVFPLGYGTAFRYVLRAAGASVAQAIGALRGPALAAGLMALSVAGLCYEFAANNVAPIVTLIAGIVTGVIAYALALRSVDRDAFALARARVGRFAGLKPTT
jgi:O-antigen/teichoic acid export membrane protein